MSSNAQEKSRGTRCELCNISTPTPADQIDHDASLMHHMKLDQFHNGSWVHRCKICKIQAGKLKNYMSHMKGKKHETNLTEEKAKWAGKSEFRTPKTFYLSTHQGDNNKNHSPNKEVQAKNRNNSQNAPANSSINKFNVKPMLVNQQQNSWAHQAYGNIPWPNQNNYGWAPNNFNQNNMQNPFWSNNFEACNWGQNSYNRNVWNPPYNNQWSNNVDNSWSNNTAVNSGFQYGYQNQTFNQPNSNIRVVSGNNQDNSTISNSEPSKADNDEAKKKVSAANHNPKTNLNKSEDSTNSRDSKRRTSSSQSRDSNHSRYSYRDGNRSRDSTPSSRKSKEYNKPLPIESFSKIQNVKDPVGKIGKDEKSKKQETNSSFKERKDGTASDSSKHSSVSKSRERVLSKKKNLTSTEKFRRDYGRKDKDGSEMAKKTSLHIDEKNNVSPEIVEVDKPKNSNDTVHLYFLSSDSDGEGHKSHKTKNKMPIRDESLAVPTTSKNKKGEGGPNSLNHIIISRLVNHPCTPRQQMQLTKWLQSQTTSKNLILPSSNLPQSEESNALANVMSELPEDILNDLYEAIEENEGDELPEMEVCLKSEPTEVESGNIPWVEFLKSLELTQEPENQEILEDSNFSENLNDCVTVKESKQDKSIQEKSTSKLKTSVVVKLEPEDSDEPETEVPETSSSLPNTESIPDSNKTADLNPLMPNVISDINKSKSNTTPDLNKPTLNVTTTHRDSFSETEANLRFSPLPQQTALSERSTSSSIPRRPPSISNSSFEGSIDRSQREINDWINKLPNSNIPDGLGTSERVQRENETTTDKNPSQEIIDNLLYLNTQEEQLREESQKVEQVISQLYRLLEEWKNKRNEIVLQETTFRNKRLKLLESLKGAVSHEKTIPLCQETQPSTSNVQYLGTLESTLTFVQELGHDLGLNIPIETSQNVISSTNCEVDMNPDSSSKSSKKTKKSSTKTKKKANPDSAIANTTKNLKTNNSKGGETKKTRKRKDEETTIISSSTKKRKKSKSTNSTQMQEHILDDYVSTVMPEHLGTTVPLLLSSSESLVEPSENSNDSFLEENTFGPVSSHNSAVIDIKVFHGYVYSCSTDKTAKRTNLRDLSDCITYAGHESTVSSIKLYTTSSGETKVFTSCHDSYLRCFDSETGECISSINLLSPVICMALEWDMAFVGLQNGQIIPYNIMTSKLLEPILGSDNVSIGYLYASNEGCTRLLFIVDYNGNVTVRNAITGLFIRSLVGQVKPPCRIIVHSLSVYITTMAKTILIFDLMTGVLQRKVTSSTSSATGIRFQGDIAICCYLDGSIKCFTKQDWKLLCILYSPDKTMTMCMDLSNKWIFTGNKFGVIQGFKYDFLHINNCKYMLCSLPFGRECDLKLHIERTHFEGTDFNEILNCPWKNCGKHFKSQTVFSKKQHILSHL